MNLLLGISPQRLFSKTFEDLVSNSQIIVKTIELTSFILLILNFHDKTNNQNSYDSALFNLCRQDVVKV